MNEDNLCPLCRLRERRPECSECAKLDFCINGGGLARLISFMVMWTYVFLGCPLSWWGIALVATGHVLFGFSEEGIQGFKKHRNALAAPPI